MPRTTLSNRSAVIVRRMRAEDVPAGLALTQSVGWSHRLHDWQLHFELGSGWVACDEWEAVAGTAMGWAYGDTAATLGLIVVHPDQQGRGIGRRLMSVVMNDASARSMQLVATPAGLKLYRESGFEEAGGIEQHQGTALPGASALCLPGVGTRAMRRADLAAIGELDAQSFGAPRTALMSALFERGAGIVAERAGRVIGFAMTRPAGSGTSIGPVVADDVFMARLLITSCLEAARGTLRIDIPTGDPELSEWLTARGLPCVDRVTLMRRGAWAHSAPDQSAVRAFALVSQALG